MVSNDIEIRSSVEDTIRKLRGYAVENGASRIRYVEHEVERIERINRLATKYGLVELAELYGEKYEMRVIERQTLVYPPTFDYNPIASTTVTHEGSLLGHIEFLEQRGDRVFMFTPSEQYKALWKEYEEGVLRRTTDFDRALEAVVSHMMESKQIQDTSRRLRFRIFGLKIPYSYKHEDDNLSPELRIWYLAIKMSLAKPSEIGEALHQIKTAEQNAASAVVSYLQSNSLLPAEQSK